MSFVANYNAVTVGATATLIMASNPERKGCIVFNNDSVTVYLGFDANVTTTTGLPLYGSTPFNNTNIYAAWRGDLYAIVATATADVRFQEW